MSDTESLAFVVDDGKTPLAHTEAVGAAPQSTSRPAAVSERASSKPQQMQKPPLHNTISSPVATVAVKTRRLKRSGTANDDVLSDTESIAFAVESEDGGSAIHQRSRAAVGGWRSASLMSNGSIQFFEDDVVAGTKPADGVTPTGVRPAIPLALTRSSSFSRPSSPPLLDNESFAFVVEEAPTARALQRSSTGAGLPGRLGSRRDSFRDDDTIQLEEGSEGDLSSRFPKNLPLPIRRQSLVNSRGLSKPLLGSRGHPDDDDSVMFQLETEDDSSVQPLPQDNSSIAFAVMPEETAGAAEDSVARHATMLSGTGEEKKTVISVRLRGNSSQTSTPRRVLRPPPQAKLVNRKMEARRAEHGMEEPPLEEGETPAKAIKAPPALHLGKSGRLVPVGKVSPRRRAAAEGSGAALHELNEDEPRTPTVNHERVTSHLMEQENQNEFVRMEYERVTSSKNSQESPSQTYRRGVEERWGTAQGLPSSPVVNSIQRSFSERDVDKEGTFAFPHIQREETCKPLADVETAPSSAQSIKKKPMGTASRPSRPRKRTMAFNAHIHSAGTGVAASSDRPSVPRTASTLHPASRSSSGAVTIPNAVTNTALQADGFTALEEAERSTEEWKMFNERQRKEIERLKQFIAAARRPEEWWQHHTARKPEDERESSSFQPHSLLSNARKALHNAPPAPATARPHKATGNTHSSLLEAPMKSGTSQTVLLGSPSKHQRGSSYRVGSHFPLSDQSRADSPLPRRTWSSKMGTAKSKRYQSQMAENPKENSRLLASYNVNTQRPATQTSVTPKKRSPVGIPSESTSPAPTAAQQFVAVETVAALVGVVWPPPLSNPDRDAVLHFTNGTRLTPEQCERFYAAVEAQKVADAAAREKALQRLLTRGPASPKRRVGVPSTLSRSHVIREVFEVMDVQRRGVLPATSLTTVKMLLEKELKVVDEELQLGGRCFGMPKMFFHPQLKAESQPLGKPPLANAVTPSRPSPRQRVTILQPSSAGWKAYLEGWQQLTQHVEAFYAFFKRRVDHGSSAVKAEAAAAASWLELLPELQIQLEQLRRRALLLSLAVNVVLPLCIASELGDMDFATVSLVVLMALDGKRSMLARSAEGVAWRETLQSYFEVLCIGNHK